MKWLIATPLVLIILLEIVLRFVVGLGNPPLAKLDPEIEYVMVPDRTYRRWHNTIEINSNGLRGPEIKAEKDSTVPRVLLIGDSVVYGTHWIDQSETIGAQLAAHRCAPEVISIAVSSWGPVNQRGYIARHGTFDADLAFVVASSHDLFDVPSPEAQYLPYRLTAPWTAIEDAWTGYLERRRSPDRTLPIELRQAQGEKAYNDLFERLKQDGVDTTLVYHPTTPQRLNGPSRARDVLYDLASANAVPVLDLGMKMDAADAYRDHIHPNALGAARISNAIGTLIHCSKDN